MTGVTRVDGTEGGEGGEGEGEGGRGGEEIFTGPLIEGSTRDPHRPKKTKKLRT